MSDDTPDKSTEHLIYRDDAAPLIPLGNTNRAGLRAFLAEAKMKVEMRSSGDDFSACESDVSANYGRNFENYARNFENYARNFENYGRSASPSKSVKSPTPSRPTLPNGDSVPDDVAELRGRMK